MLIALNFGAQTPPPLLFLLVIIGFTPGRPSFFLLLIEGLKLLGPQHMGTKVCLIFRGLYGSVQMVFWHQHCAFVCRQDSIVFQLATCNPVENGSLIKGVEHRKWVWSQILHIKFLFTTIITSYHASDTHVHVHVQLT